MRRLGRARAVASLVAVFAFVGCTGEEAGRERPTVVVTVPPLAYPVERLAGGRVEIAVLVPPGASPTTFEPTLRELRAMERAELFVKVGHAHFPFERAWLDPLLGSREELRIVDASRALDAHDGDPHVWLSFDAMRATVGALATELSELLPEHAGEVFERARAFEDELSRLETEVALTLEPFRGRSFLVLHPAWGRLVEPYGLVELAIEPEGKEPTPAVFAELLEQARGAGATLVVVQPQLDPTTAELVARELGARVLSLDPLAADWAENLRTSARLLAAELRRADPANVPAESAR